MILIFFLRLTLFNENMINSPKKPTNDTKSSASVTFIKLTVLFLQAVVKFYERLSHIKT